MMYTYSIYIYLYKYIHTSRSKITQQIHHYQVDFFFGAWASMGQEVTLLWMHPVTGRARCLRNWMLTGAQQKTQKCAWNKTPAPLDSLDHLSWSVLCFLLLNFKLIADCWLCIHRTRSCDTLGVICACGLSQRPIVFWPAAVHWIAANHNTWKEELDGFKKHSKVGWKTWKNICFATKAVLSILKDPESSFHFFRFHAWP